MDTGAHPIVLNYGGGVQSVAMLVLVVRGLIPRPAHIVMARVAREHPRTFRYLDESVRPWLAPHGLTVTVVEPDDRTPGLYYKPDDALPLVGGFTGAQERKPFLCSGHWKRDLLMRWLRAQGYGPKSPVEQWIGYSVDEKRRATGKSRAGWITPRYPLLTMVPLRREHCVRLVEQAGLPTPAKSSCFDCANKSDAEWRALKQDEPELFQLAVRREAEIRARDPRRDFYLHRSALPLDLVSFRDEATDDEPSLFAAGCNSAGCWT